MKTREITFVEGVQSIYPSTKQNDVIIYNHLSYLARLRSHNQYDSKSAMFPKSGYKVKSHCIYKNSSRSIYSSFLVSKSIVKFFIDFRANFFLYHSFYIVPILFIFCTVHKPLISFYYLGVKEVKRKAIVILNTV